MIYRICEMSLHTLPRESTVNKKESVAWRKTVSVIAPKTLNCLVFQSLDF
jgi:hypothetical protein